MTAETAAAFPPDLSQLSRSAWLNALRTIGQERGFAEPLGAEHAAFFVEEGDTLLVSFETMGGIQALSDTRTPYGFEMLTTQGWSSLTIMSHGDTWFRAPEVYAFFDQLQDDGFFDEFERVLFYGAGPCGYAAAAYSVSSPGARVLVLQPQATLDPRLTEWDDRFAEQRRRDFTSRYGYAPDMLDGAMQAAVLYDPHEPLDAMHAALFARPNVARFRLPFMGGALQSDLLTLEILPELLTALAEDRLGVERFAALMRRRRTHPPYLRRLLAKLDEAERPRLARMLCENVTARMDAPRFRRRLAALNAEPPEYRDGDR
ncbi:phosphoadenosine phosphosulfate reductase [Cognatishimia sp. F0-27]|uniref:phosphoadenosine phosphosulfate reductase n=1 Tax=Cognatishimia sp. F0-27 TaxID=2816855 RepID=UPI001D0C9EA7|nr:phosphoadenosine phosphosulfate reductase [Cognatishimia sp. F0-27]MCC1493450.1 phosphoadenosine phosphosulfate reductase [Cognatishimia sp. F0-27]